MDVANGATNDSSAWRPDPKPWGLTDLVAVLVWSAAIAAFFWDAVTFRGALFYFDVTELNFAYRDFLANEIRHSRFSRWFPGLYCGLPLFSESQAGYLHPLKYVLYPWLATWKAFNLDTVGSVWLTGLATFGWLRQRINTSGALTGAAIFALGGYEWAHLIHTSMVNALISVPLIVWATEWSWRRGRLSGVVLGALALAAQVFAGHLQDTLLTVALLALYTGYRVVTETGWRPRLMVVSVAAGVVGIGIGLAAVQWVPSKELLDRSPRAAGLGWGDLTYGSWSPELIPALVVREIYGTRARDTDWMDGFYPYHEMDAYLGLSALALAAIGAGAARDRWVAFWIILAIVGGMLMLGRFTFLFDFAHRIPVARSSRIPVRFHLWVSLAVAALAAVGVDRIERGFPVRFRGALILVGGLVLVSIPILIYVYTPVWTEASRWTSLSHRSRFHWLSREVTLAAFRNLALGLGAAGAIVTATRSRSPRWRSIACGLIPLLVLTDLFGAHWVDVPTVPPQYWTVPPLSVKRLQADPALIRVFGVAAKSAAEPGFASRPINFMAVRDTLDWSLPPVWGLKTSRGETPIIPRRLLEFTDNAKIGGGRFDIESISHLVMGQRVRPSVASALHLGEPDAVGAAFVYKNPGAFPRARLAGHPYYASGEAEAVKALQQLGPAIRDRLVVEDPDRPLSEDAEVVGTARIKRDDPEHVTIETDSAGPSYLVLSDTYDPGWSATIDGIPAPIRPAWVAFRAVSLASGPHRVDFVYEPAGFATGVAISLAALLAAACCLVWPRRLARTRPTHDTLNWPRRWPLWLLLAALAIVAASAVRVGPHGRPEWQTRWSSGLHRFTWGARLEAIQVKPKG